MLHAMYILIDVPTQTKGTISGLFATSAFSGSFWSIQHAHTGDMIMMYNTCTIMYYSGTVFTLLTLALLIHSYSYSLPLLPCVLF